ncbi:MAG: S1C family serine protease [Candidatus Doudnabacteria bacterium]|jgi:serine protease Do
MNKKKITVLIIVCVLTGWVFNVLMGRFLTAKLSTWPVLNRMQLLSPQAPIVINNKETIRVSDSGDVTLAVAGIKSKTSTVVLVTPGQVQVLGSAINLTSNGDFVTGNATFLKSVGDFYVVLNDGRSAKITAQEKDAATALVYFKASLDNVPTANFGNSSELAPGDKVVLVQKSLQNFYNKAYLTTVVGAQKDIAGTIFNSDFLKRGFSAGSDEAWISGEVAVNANGEVVGIYNGLWLVSSDVLKQSLSLYLSSPNKISRPAFGFSYVAVTPVENKLVGVTEGIKISEVENVSAAHNAGLLVGDVIVQIDNRQTNAEVLPEEILQQYKPNDKITLKVSRKSQIINLTIIPSELK